jgi:ABC-type transporter Mla MlaB component
MARPVPAHATLTFEGPSLTRRSSEALAAQLAAPGSSAREVVVDCHNIERVDPAGLCALLDLAQSHDTTRCVLVALTPTFLRSALEVGLASWYAICRDADLAHQLLQSERA